MTGRIDEEFLAELARDREKHFFERNRGSVREIFPVMLKKLMQRDNVRIGDWQKHSGYDTIRTIRDEWIGRTVPPALRGLVQTCKVLWRVDGVFIDR